MTEFNQWEDNLPEQKLPVQISHINLVQVDNMYVFEATESQIFKELTTEATST